MSVKVIKLITGEELIAKDDKTVFGSGSITLNNVFQLMILPQKDGSQQIGLFPFQLYSSAHDELLISKHHIVFEAEANKELIKHYQELTSSIILPPTGNKGLISL